MAIDIYVLELENAKFYVGQANDVENRFQQHIKGKFSSEWTKLNRPLKIHKIFNTTFTDMSDAMTLENEITIKYMKEYGWQNVRGGDFCTLDIDKLRFLLALKSDFGNELLPIKNEKNYNLKTVGYIFYVLELENNNYFIGTTKNLLLAILNENNKLGSDWTKLHKPIALINVIKITEDKSEIIKQKHNDLVIHFMKKYGFKNVRGGDFYKVDERNHKNKVLNYTDIFIKDRLT
jgi:predicted GIY-YIG superfamily endonuclease